jgi:broad specificity phosphatase PhoE
MFDVQRRAVRGLLTLVRRYPDATVVVVSHGDVLRSMLLFALGMPIDFFHRLDPLPARVNVVEFGESVMPRVLVMNGDTVP